MARSVALLLALALFACDLATGQDELRVGHFVQVKGALDADGRFIASSVEVLEPLDEESLVGDVEELIERDGELELSVLGQRVTVGDDVELERITPGELSGARVKVSGYYRGPRKFSAREIQRRDPGRNRLEARIDALERTDEGLLLSVMRFAVVVPRDVEIESDGPLGELPLAPAREVFLEAARVRDDDDDIPGLPIGGDFYLGTRVEFRGEVEDDHDLDAGLANDRRDTSLSLRSELTYRPPGNFYGLLGARYEFVSRDDDDEADSFDDGTLRLTEAYGYWRDIGVTGLDLQMGRQDFDEQREWLYDQNLDALRLHYARGDARFELSYSTRLADGSALDEATENLMAIARFGDDDKSLGAYVVDRRDGRGPDDFPIHFGLRALGDWLPDNEVWAELSTVRGYEGDVDLRGHALDVGTTWSPPSADPWAFTFGYAFGSGDDDVSDGVDGNFRQTGLHDNNDKWGGVTSFRYYGELFDPELSNLGILTLGAGRRFGRDTSVDVVLHHYRQSEAVDELRDSGVKRRPTGLDDDLGWELDVIFGSRALADAHAEVVLGAFEPGDAFDDADRAYLFKVQLRWSF